MTMFFDGWFGIVRVLVVGVGAYASLVLILRVSGKRTLSKMNAFDLVVTVALGSILATVLLAKDVALAEGIAAFGLLIGLQFVIAWLSARSRRVEGLVKAEPSLLWFQGRLQRQTLRRERVTESEVYAAVRAQGLANMDDAGAVVLETNGDLTVLGRQPEYSTLKDVMRPNTRSPRAPGGGGAR